MSDETRRELVDWLRRFERCVREVDYDTARPLFLDSVNCFGSVTHHMRTRRDLIEQQWKRVWPNIDDFTFDEDALDVQLSDDGEMACLILPWASTGYRDGRPFSRRGRVTLLLRRDPAGGAWRAYHSHYSLTPPTD